MANSKVFTTSLVLALLLNLPGIISTPHPAAATPDEVKWSRVNIPTEGERGNWVLASGSNVQLLTMAADGSLYSYANPSGTSYTLFKSTDAGHSWSTTGKVTDAIIDIAAAPDDASIVYYATVANIYESTDAGASFTLLPLSPGGAGSNNIEITSLDIARLDSQSIIAVGTKDTDAAQYGGVYTLDENEPLTGWINTNIGNYDVYKITFSPNFAADRQLIAVVTDETDTLIISRIDDADWGQAIGDASIEGLTPISAAIAFPADYDATTEDHVLFIAIDTGSNNGDVYMVSGMWAPGNSWATDLDIGADYNLDNIDVSGLAVSGNTTAASILAGAASSTQVYISTDNGNNWTRSRSRKKPTGQSKTWVFMTPDFTNSGIAYAATSGTESAFSYTTDGGITWNQMSLIDTKISANGIIDLSLSPNYNQDSTLFMLTFDGEHTEHSLWRSLNSGANWARVLNGTTASADSMSLVELSPQYGSSRQVVFLAGTSSGNSAIWKSTDNGQTFIRLGAPFSIDTWKIANDNTLFLGSYDGNNGLVYRTTNSGLSYSSGTVAGSQPIKSIVLSPDYQQDGTLLIGNTNGWVYWSEDNGTSFKQLGEQLPPSSPSSGEVTVAFDPKFSSNKIVYAASAVKATTTSNDRIYRFTVGKSTTWESVDNIPIDGILSQLTVSADGALYATNSQQTDATSGEGGMERSLNPTYPLGPTFETVTRGLDDDATLTGLWLQGSQLWSIDSTNTRLMTYNDSLARAVTLISPPDKTPGTGTGNFSLTWETLKGATEYKWQLSYDTNFSTVPAEFEGETKKGSARLPSLATATTYYWKVRATQPVLSRWSDKWSFTTTLGTSVVAPELYSPEAGASGAPIKPVFQWSALTGADSYELLVSTDVSFSSPIVVKIGDYALPTTAWQSDINLDYDTAYYWQVRASSANSYSAWSAVGVFTTGSPPSALSSPPELPSPPSLHILSPLLPSPPSPPPPPPPPPSPLAQPTIPN